MCAYGPNYGANFAGEAEFVEKVPTKTVTAELCVNTNTEADLCVNTGTEAELCVNNSTTAGLCV